MQAYLSQEHIAAIETGCPVSALGSEMPRQAPEVRRAATIHIKEMIDLFARQLPNWGQPEAHEQAMATGVRPDRHHHAGARRRRPQAVATRCARPR